jgi:hypothetical protein
MHWLTNGTSSHDAAPYGQSQRVLHCTPGATQTLCSWYGIFTRHCLLISVGLTPVARYPGRHPQRSFCPKAEAQGAVMSQLLGLAVHSIQVAGGGVRVATGPVGFARFRVKRSESERRRKLPLSGDMAAENRFVEKGASTVWELNECRYLQRM